MIARSGNSNFWAAHYEWIVLGVGVAALVAGVAFYAVTLGEDVDRSVAAVVAEADALKPGETGVKPLDLTLHAASLGVARKPPLVNDDIEGKASFLASERRIRCCNADCGKAIPGDAKVCPYCQTKQAEEKPVVLDADGDGMPDEWEKRYGLNATDAADAATDADGDGFTNEEEFAAKTDPTDRRDHPDYLDSLAVTLPLKTTKMPFSFNKADKIPSGWRLSFFVPDRKDNYGRRGLMLTAKIGEKIVDAEAKYDTGFTVKGYEPKTEKVAIKGTDGMTKNEDVSVATVARASDGKVVELVVQPNKKTAKLASVDIQATLTYTRGGVKTFEVVPGAEIDLNGSKYKVLDITAKGKGAAVTLADSFTGKTRTLEALD